MLAEGWELLGLAIQDYHEGDLGAEINVISVPAGIERMPISIFFRNFNQLSELEHFALSLCKERVLDIGAGAGCHSLILQEQGFLVTGIDLSVNAVEVMKRRGLKSCFCSDIKDFEIEPVDTIIMMMNGIGLVENLAGLDYFLNDIKRLLRPGGQILLDSSDLMNLFEDEFKCRKGFMDQIDYYGEIRYEFEYKGIKSNPLCWLFVDPETLQDHAVKTGWYCQIIFEDEEDHYLARLVRSF